MPRRDSGLLAGVVRRSECRLSTGTPTLLTAYFSAFAHSRDVISGGDLAPGQSVSFVIEDGVKGPSAKQIHQEEGEQAPVQEEDEGERLYGTVKVRFLELSNHWSLADMHLEHQ